MDSMSSFLSIPSVGTSHSRRQERRVLRALTPLYISKG